MATRLITSRLAEVGSTQIEARRRAAEHDGHPFLLIADRQTGGRGRSGKHWVTAPRALACSLVVTPVWEPSGWGTIPLVAGLAAREALRTEADFDVGLKWPNDVVTPSGKVGGLIAESEDKAVVVGFGANLWWPAAPAGMAAVYQDDPGPDMATEVATRWADHLLAVLAGASADWGRGEYRNVCLTLGTEIVWQPEGSGEAVDVAVDGGLVVSTSSGYVTLYSEEVHSVRPTTVAPERGRDDKRARP